MDEQSVPGTPATAEPAATSGGPVPAASSGDPVLAAVSAAVQRIEDLAARPLAEHAAGYQEISAQLQDALAQIDG